MKKLLLFLAFFFAVSTEAQTNTARMLSGVNAQTGTTYTFVCTDATKLVTFNNGSSVSATLFAASDQCSGPGIMFSVKNIGAGTVTITSTSTINGSANLVLQPGQGADIWNDGLTYTSQGSTSSGPPPPPGFPRLDQIPDQNQNKAFNQGTATLAFTGGPGLNLSGETSPATIPLIAGCTATSNGQLCFDTTGLNYHGYQGADAIIPSFVPSGVTSGDIAGFLLTGGKWTLTDLGPPSSSGGTPITAIISNIADGDSLCWDSTLTPPSFVNCPPGVPPVVISGTSYVFDGSERGEILYFTNAGAKALTLPQASDTGAFGANWFTFVKNDGAGLITITTSTSTFFSTGGTTLTIGQGIGCSIFSDPSSTGLYYDRCSPVPLTASTNITLTPAAYAISIAAAGSGGGTITGAGTSNNSTKWTGAATIGNGSMLEDGTHAVRADVGFDVNQLGAYLWWATNNAGTGTTVNKMACDDGTGKAIICPFASASTNSPIGVAVAANGATPGNAGSTGICIIGFCSVIMDNGATAGHYAQSSTTVNGDLSDVGTTIPTNGQSYWYIFTGNAGAGTAAIIRNLTPSELNASSVSGGNGKSSQISVNGTATTKGIKNFNATTPAAGANNQNLVWQTSNAANTDSISVEVPIANTAQGGIISGSCAAGKILSGGSPNACIDFSDVKIIPAANCPNAVAGSGWSYATSTWTAACRAGTNNLGGALQLIPATGGAAQFRFEIPSDWDSASQPFIRIEYGSGANASGTVIWTVASACTKADGSITDDPAFNAESAFGTQTMAAANRAWSQTGQFTAITGGNNCVGGGGLIIKLTLSGTAASAINAYQAVVTTQRLPAVQAN